MELDRSLLEMIDEYISDALAVTGTRKAPRATQPHAIVTEPGLESDAQLPLIDEETADALLVLVGQQLAESESTLEPLPRTRAPRGTIELDDEITNIVKRPPEQA